MTETYSLSVTGYSADNRFQPKGMTIGDSACQSAGGEQGIMAAGTPFLVKMPDGSQVWHVYDAERSVPPNYLVVRRL